jgi:hypothetical protein
MKSAFKRLSTLAMFCFLPLALMAKARGQTSPAAAARLYYICIYGFLIFLWFLALYTYWQGGSFIKIMGTFY